MLRKILAATMVVTCSGFLVGGCSFDSAAFGARDSGIGDPIDGAPIDGALVDGAPIDGALVDGAPVDGAPVDGPVTPRLVDRGLLARYFIDEAESGQGPVQLEDAALDPLPLAITYGPELSFAGALGQRHLAWNTINQDGRASVAVDGTKLAALQGSKTATIEVVFNLQEATVLNSRISHIGADQESGRLSLTTVAVDRLQVYLNGEDLIGEWLVDLATVGRIVVHVVIDTTKAADRVMLYVNGSALTASGGTPPSQEATIDLATGRHFVLGNREIGGRSFRGDLHYGALYSNALDDAEVQNNATLLQLSDDTP